MTPEVVVEVGVRGGEVLHVERRFVNSVKKKPFKGCLVRVLYELFCEPGISQNRKCSCMTL